MEQNDFSDGGPLQAKGQQRGDARDLEKWGKGYIRRIVGLQVGPLLEQSFPAQIDTRLAVFEITDAALRADDHHGEGDLASTK